MKNIALIAGGDSSEYVVSLKSAQGLYPYFDTERYRVYLVLMRKGKWTVEAPEEIANALSNGITDILPTKGIAEIDKNDFSFQVDGQKIKIDYAYITIHGHPGEDGRLQGYFDLLGIPYSSCGVLASAMTFNKYINNQFLKTQGIRVADSILLQKNTRKEVVDTDEIIHRLGLPVFVKPNDGGSSFGITKVKEESQLLSAINKAFTEGNGVIVERFIAGTEVTCGCYKTKAKQVVFPITEVVTENEFFDFDAKYKGKALEITPARLTKELTTAIQQETLRIYDLIGAKGIIRVDYIIPSDNLPVILEVNTTPGMTENSFIPQQIKASGMDVKDVLTDIIENSLL